MTWKSYAAVSGATVLAGWLASAPPSNAPVNGPTPSRQSPRAAAATPTNIEQEAARLQARLQAERAYTEPHRNPFRFVDRDLTPGDRATHKAAPDTPPSAVASAPPAPRVSLSGIAEEPVNGALQRTAVLSSPAGVLLVREGDEILGYYRVGRIDSEAVELVGLADGTSTRLALGGR